MHLETELMVRQEITNNYYNYNYSMMMRGASWGEREFAFYQSCHVIFN